MLTQFLSKRLYVRVIVSLDRERLGGYWATGVPSVFELPNPASEDRWQRSSFRRPELRFASTQRRSLTTNAATSATITKIANTNPKRTTRVESDWPMPVPFRYP